MVEKECKQCSKVVPKRKTFCNKSCAAKYNNAKREKKPLPKCKNCQKELKNRVKVYCNNKCQNSYQRKTRILPEYEKGKITSRGTLKRVLKEERGNICNTCGISKWNKKEIVLEVHHIDGDPFNNMPDNLELICPNCHSQTPSFKGRNRGKGRKLGSI